MMKHLLRYGVVIFSFFLMSFISVTDIINAMKNGNASELSKYFDNTIEITFPDKSNAYSKSQAEMVVKDFFNNNSVKNFEVIQQGDNDGTLFFIGTLATTNGEYRTTFFVKQKGEKPLLQEIRFEK